MGQLAQAMSASAPISKLAYAPAAGNGIDLMRRFLTGITSRFRLRASAWILSVILFGIGVTLISTPDIFSTHVHVREFAYLARLGSQTTIAVYCFVVASARFAALIINGTFPQFRYTPHIRAVTSFLSCFVWLQLALGAVMNDDGAIDLPVYMGLLCFEVFSTYIATLEIERHAD